jgi:uncharacterized protein (DUF2141 family)
MVKKAILFCGILFAALPLAYAQETFKISGFVCFQEDADIYMALLTKTEWWKMTISDTTILAPRPRTIVIKPTLEQKKAKKAAFEFIGVPGGSYGIRVFQDVNQNGEPDRCSLGFIKEPYASYRLAGETDWENIKFQVNKDIKGIDIQLR